MKDRHRTARHWLRVWAHLGRLFPRSSAVEAVRTRVHFDATPAEVWQRMLFYEEVPRRPMSLLRLFLPAPLRTEGAKTRVGETIRCIYESGWLEKRITAVEPVRLIHFEVGQQALGIEDCISTTGGSYEIESDGAGAGCALVLTTRYCGHLRPRWMWRRLERFLAHRLHHHILQGMRVLLEQEDESRSTWARAHASVRSGDGSGDLASRAREETLAAGAWRRGREAPRQGYTASALNVARTHDPRRRLPSPRWVSRGPRACARCTRG